jgi:hypothetical protein
MMAIRRVAHFSIPVSDAKAASEGDQGEVGARLIRLSQRDDGVDCNGSGCLDSFRGGIS